MENNANLDARNDVQNSSAGVASFEWDRSRSLRFLVFGFLYGLSPFSTRSRCGL